MAAPKKDSRAAEVKAQSQPSRGSTLMICLNAVDARRRYRLLAYLWLSRPLGFMPLDRNGLRLLPSSSSRTWRRWKTSWRGGTLDHVEKARCPTSSMIPAMPALPFLEGLNPNLEYIAAKVLADPIRNRPSADPRSSLRRMGGARQTSKKQN
jgi:hypothetical protein